MYVILNESGLGVTHDTSPNKVYEATLVIPSEGRYMIHNDNGTRQDVYAHNFQEIPSGTFVGTIPERHSADFVGIIDRDYKRDKTYLMKKGSPCEYIFKDDVGDTRHVFHQAVDVVADPWGIIEVPRRAKFFPQRRLRLHESVGPFKAGDDVFADRTNISGSYMVPSPYGGGGSVIVKPQICTVVEAGKIVEVTIPEGFQVKPTSNQKAPVPFQKQEAPKHVKKQKEVAKELLKYATMMDPHAMLAGGAPRNWYLGLEANDLDFFIRPHRAMSETYMRDAMRRIGITEVFNKASEEAPGVTKKNRFSRENQQKEAMASDQKIRYVLEGQYMGETVQFIILHENSTIGLDYCIRYFDTSINMISMTLDSDSDELVEHRAPRFDDSINLGVIFVQDNGSAYGNGDHLERIHSYFPEAPMVREKYRDDVRRNPERAWELAEDWEDLV